MKKEEVKKSEPLYKSFRKKIYKGQVARTGTLFLYITVKLAKMNCSAVIQVRGGLTTEQEKEITDGLYKNLKDKYKFN